MHPTREALLHCLADADGPVSGDALARELGISRTAVWKHVQALNRGGQTIEAGRGVGYRLRDDVLVASLLAERLAGLRIGSRCMVVEEVDSTNSALMRMAGDDAENAPDGLVMLAERQTGGRGRLRRTWHSFPGDALAMSVLLRPRIAPARAPQLALLAAVAVQRALEPLLPRVRIKWPNDILCDGCKLAGILTEMRAEPDCVQAVVVGIGVNVRAPRGGWPAEVAGIAGDVASLSGGNPRRMAIAEAILRAMNDLYEDYLEYGFERVREAWWRAHAARGGRVRVHNGEAYIEGVAEALDEDGALLLRGENGLQRIISGDLQLMEENHA